LGKVDSTIHKELANKYGVKGFPTLKFISGDSVVDYNSGRTASDIVSWLKS